MRNAQPFTMKPSEGYFTRIVIASIVERYAKSYTFLAIVEQRDAVHSTTHDDNCIFLCHYAFEKMSISDQEAHLLPKSLIAHGCSISFFIEQRCTQSQCSPLSEGLSLQRQNELGMVAGKN